LNTAVRNETRVVRHWMPSCVVCGATLHRAATGRRRRYCGGACRQRAWRLRDEARHKGNADGRAADPAEVTRLLAAALGLAGRR